MALLSVGTKIWLSIITWSETSISQTPLLNPAECWGQDLAKCHYMVRDFYKSNPLICPSACWGQNLAKYPHMVRDFCKLNPLYWPNRVEVKKTQQSIEMKSETTSIQDIKKSESWELSWSVTEQSIDLLFLHTGPNRPFNEISSLVPYAWGQCWG